MAVRKGNKPRSGAERRERERRGTKGPERLGGKRGQRGGKRAKRRDREQRRTARAEHRGSVRAVAGRVAIVVLAFAATVVPAVFVNDVIGYIPLLALVLVIGISFAYLQVLKRSLTFSEASLLPSCERGADIEFVLYFKNSSPLVFTRLEPYIYISDLFGGTDTVTPTTMVLMPFEERDFRFQAKFDHIGAYSAGVKKIVVRDLLGLFSHTISNDSRHMVQVLPRLFSVARMDFTAVSSEESQRAFQAQVSDDMDYAGARDYEWGDPLKAIHWKLSASQPEGKYLTRLYETYNDPGISIIIDTSSPAYDAESLMFVYDAVVESALSVNEYARDQGLDSVIMYADDGGASHSLRVLGLQEFAGLAAELPRIQVGDGERARELLRREGNRIHARDNIAYCTAHVDEGVISTLIEIKNRKRNPMLLVAVPPSLDPVDVREITRPLRRLDGAQIVYYVVGTAADLGQGGGA